MVSGVDLLELKQQLFGYLTKKIVTFLSEITLIFVSLSISLFWVQGVGPMCNHKGLPSLPNPDNFLILLHGAGGEIQLLQILKGWKVAFLICQFH